MGLLLSILVGCVGVVELLLCLRHTTNRMSVISDQDALCLYYNNNNNFEDKTSLDFMYNVTHPSQVNIKETDKIKLENLFAYSLRVRNDLRSLRHQIKGSVPINIIEDIFSSFGLDLIFNNIIDNQNIDIYKNKDSKDVISTRIQDILLENLSNRQVDVNLLEQTKLLSKIYELLKKKYLVIYPEREYFKVSKETKNLKDNEITVRNISMQSKYNLIDKNINASQKSEVNTKPVNVQISSVTNIFNPNFLENIDLNITFNNILEDEEYKNLCITYKSQDKNFLKDKLLNENLICDKNVQVNSKFIYGTISCDKSKNVKSTKKIDIEKQKDSISLPEEICLPDTRESQAFWVNCCFEVTFTLKIFLKNIHLSST